jgi:hypothetical protein
MRITSPPKYHPLNKNSTITVDLVSNASSRQLNIHSRNTILPMNCIHGYSNNNENDN